MSSVVQSDALCIQKYKNKTENWKTQNSGFPVLWLTFKVLDFQPQIVTNVIYMSNLHEDSFLTRIYLT